MYTPFAFSDKEMPINEEDMLEVLNKADKNHCNCPAGAAGSEVGYLSPGTSMDYTYSNLGIAYSYAFEIYGDEMPQDNKILFKHSKG